MKTLVALPSYNEAENITQLVEKILSLSENYHIVVIDDNSPDQTFEILNAFIVNLPSHDQQRVHAIKRVMKDGRGGAVWHGINWGIASEIYFENFVEKNFRKINGKTFITNHDKLILAKHKDDKSLDEILTEFMEYELQ